MEHSMNISLTTFKKTVKRTKLAIHYHGYPGRNLGTFRPWLHGRCGPRGSGCRTIAEAAMARFPGKSWEHMKINHKWRFSLLGKSSNQNSMVDFPAMFDTGV